MAMRLILRIIGSFGHFIRALAFWNLTSRHWGDCCQVCGHFSVMCNYFGAKYSIPRDAYAALEMPNRILQ